MTTASCKESLNVYPSDEVLSRTNQSPKRRYYLGCNYKNTYLTQREMEVAALTIDKLTNKRIGEMLGISQRTIECYINSMRLKLNCINKVELIEKLVMTNAVIQFRCREKG